MKKIKEVMPDAFIGVDVIVGTRGETEEYIEEISLDGGVLTSNFITNDGLFLLTADGRIFFVRQ